ncbi:MAG: XisI protein [Bacteroidota bacterium]
MDRVNKLKEVAVEFLEEHIQEVYKEDDSDISTELIYDHERGHYQLMRIGWGKSHFHYSCLFHFQIRNSKIWILNNDTEELVGDELVKKGVKKEEIVFAFHDPAVRQFTEFAVG